MMGRKKRENREKDSLEQSKQKRLTRRKYVVAWRKEAAGLSFPVLTTVCLT